MDRHEFTRPLVIEGVEYTIFDIHRLQEKGLAAIDRLPFTIRILVENLLRKMDGNIVREDDLLKIARWQPRYPRPVEIPFHPARVLMQDYTGVPAVVDLAAMRDAVKAVGGNPEIINPLIPVEFVVDHSIQIDHFGSIDALNRNVEKEYQRNSERYTLLKWAQNSFDNFLAVPPRSGICHQVNLEYLARVVITEEKNGHMFAYPDTVFGTDSHTTMIDSIGIVGTGVGGIEAEAVMLGQPYYMSIPEVIAVRMSGRLSEGVTATDLVLTVTRMLREHNVVEKYVEYIGPGLKTLSIPDRATIANMTPEAGATVGFFPVDAKTIEYLKLTNREQRAVIVEAYTRAQGLFYSEETEIEYSEVLELDLSAVVPSVAGPARPQDCIALCDLKQSLADLPGGEHHRKKTKQRFISPDESGGQAAGFNASGRPAAPCPHHLEINGRPARIGDGSIVIAAVTSCTNTSNPDVMIGAGLVARKAVERGLQVPPHVKTSLAPGSKVVNDYLNAAGLTPYLQALGFHTAAFGCTTCIGNSGPLHPEIEKIIREKDLNVAAVLSGNRNFEARIHQRIKSNFLASPLLVVAFALAGRINVDLTREPLGFDPNGTPVYLADIWPTADEIRALTRAHVRRDFYKTQYDQVFDGDKLWHGLTASERTTYDWDPDSTYAKRPPFFDDFTLDPAPAGGITGARALLLLGDSITTDHISPAGAFSKDYPAGRYLVEKNVAPDDFNSYGTRRGNHEVMMRGTFGNVRIKNRMTAPREGSYTLKFPERKEMFVFDAAMQYQKEKTALIVLGGKEFGGGSSRDWAAKGPLLLGVKAVIAESFERIHRSNLIGMGLLPLEFTGGQGWQALGLDGSETFSVDGIADMSPRKALTVTALKEDGRRIEFGVIARIDTEIEVEYYRHGGILPFVVRKMIREKQ